jgi:hypothetical protein
MNTFDNELFPLTPEMIEWLKRNIKHDYEVNELYKATLEEVRENIFEIKDVEKLKNIRQSMNILFDLIEKEKMNYRIREKMLEKNQVYMSNFTLLRDYIQKNYNPFKEIQARVHETLLLL